MQTAIVIPCRNEERSVAGTARSLGFGAPGVAPPPDTTLILVDNASIDGTLQVLEGIRQASPPGSVQVAQEPERGYVPPRHRGVELAKALAVEKGASAEKLLILQADADTYYEPGYLAAMQAAARSAGPGALIEGGVHPPHRFLTGHPGFQALADAVDDSVAAIGAPDADDVIVDDKVSGFTLATYLDWGGLRREYNSHGAELHAETSRLYIRGRLRGGHRVRAADAFAAPSRRKILHNPVRHFATAGFPREEAWWRAWSRRHPGLRDLEAFESPDGRAALAPAIATRRAHLIVLFTALPLYLDRELNPKHPPSKTDPLVEAFIAQLSGAPRSATDNLAPLFEGAFALMEDWTDRFGLLVGAAR